MKFIPKSLWGRAIFFALFSLLIVIVYKIFVVMFVVVLLIIVAAIFGFVGLVFYRAFKWKI